MMRARVFTTPTCIKCKKMKAYLEGAGISFEVVDATTPEGMAEAKKMNLMSVPMVVVYDDSGKQIGTAHDIDELEELI